MADTGGIAITKHGRPSAKSTPSESSCAHLISGLRGKIRKSGDVFSTGWSGTPVSQLSTAPRGGERLLSSQRGSLSTFVLWSTWRSLIIDPGVPLTYDICAYAKAW